MSITPVVTDHGEGFDDPLSKPGLPSNCCVEPPPLLVTVKLMAVECVLPPPLPVTIMLYVPVAVALPARNVSADEPLPGAAIEDVLKFAVAPAGKPDALSAIAELKPPEIVLAIVEVLELLCAMENTEGFAEIVKSPAGPPAVLAFKAKSSTMKDVCRLPFSVPTR